MSKEEKKEITGMKEFGKELATKIDTRKKTLVEMKKQRAESQARRDAEKK